MKIDGHLLSLVPESKSNLPFSYGGSDHLLYELLVGAEL
jgi:hypothetical protein